MRLVRVIDSGGVLRIIDFAAEAAPNRPEPAAVVQARQERDRAQAAAKEAAAAAWCRAIRVARAAGVPEAQIVRAAGRTAAEVSALSSTRKVRRPRRKRTT
jgi:hypothetical protein